MGVIPVTLVGALNLIWAVIGVTAFAALGISEYRRRSGSPLWFLRRAVAVSLVIAALFPCVSASDDVFSFRFLEASLGKHGKIGTPAAPEDGKEQANLQLARVLYALEHFQTSGYFSLVVTFCFFAVLAGAERRSRPRTPLCRAGRAPPASF